MRSYQTADVRLIVAVDAVACSDPRAEPDRRAQLTTPDVSVPVQHHTVRLYSTDFYVR